MSLVSASAFDELAPWRVSPQVSLRDESFGALAYNHDNRRLVFLKSPELVALVRQLGDYQSAHDAIDALVAPEQRARYERALHSLATSEIICGR